MNLKAKDLGLTKTHFRNSTGLDLSQTEAGAYGTAMDMALLMEHVITRTPDAIARTTVDTARIKNKQGAYHSAENTNEIVGNIDGLIASKTGSTELAGGNLVIAFDAGLDHPIIVSVLGSTYSGRFDDTLTLVRETQKYLASQ
jgi:D-alanyl-D-alanine carboxypeptidase